MTVNKNDTLELLPHRPPFRFLTEVVRIEFGKCGEAVWRVTGAEDFLEGHFPSEPIVPGVLITEALAQLSGLVAFFGNPEDDGSDKLTHSARSPGRNAVRLAHIECRFNRTVTPPAEIRLQTERYRVVENLHQFEVGAWVGDDLVAKGRLTLALRPTKSEAGGRW